MTGFEICRAVCINAAAIFFGALSILSSATSNADTVTWIASGTLSQLETSSGFITEFPDAAVGTPFVLEFAFDPVSPVSSVTSETDFGGGVYFGTRYRYYDALSTVRLSIDGVDLNRATTGFVSFDVYDNFGWNSTTMSPCSSGGGPGATAACDGIAVIRNLTSSTAGGFANINLTLRGPEHLDINNGAGLPVAPSPLLTALSLHLMQFSDSGDFMLGNVDNVVVAIDADADGVLDSLDNCTLAGNPGQLDADGDGYGNVCDADFNNDCAVNSTDLGVMRAEFFGGSPITDMNGDGTTNAADLGLLKGQFFAAPGPSSVGNCP